MTLRLAILFTLAGACYAQQEIIQYGPWKGWWTKARLSAYSPHDALDKAYHESKGERWRWITADGRTDVRRIPHGIAAAGRFDFGTRIFIPTGYGYLDQGRSGLHSRVFTVDDRGGFIESKDVPGESAALDLRYKTEHSALAFGVKDAWVFIITEDAK